MGIQTVSVEALVEVRDNGKVYPAGATFDMDKSLIAVHVAAGQVRLADASSPAAATTPSAAATLAAEASALAAEANAFAASEKAQGTPADKQQFPPVTK
jgi:hypothetical protein